MSQNRSPVYGAYSRVGKQASVAKPVPYSINNVCKHSRYYSYGMREECTGIGADILTNLNNLNEDAFKKYLDYITKEYIDNYYGTTSCIMKESQKLLPIVTAIFTVYVPTMTQLLEFIKYSDCYKND